MGECNVRVIARFRPINEREKREGDKHHADISLNFPDDNRCEVKQGGRDPQIFTFDRIFWDTSTTQEQIYELAARDSIEDVLEGYNSTVFAYGQTGSGKSFTMFGPDITNSQLWGIIPRSCAHIFNYIEEDQNGTEFTIKCSFLEIYLERARDLLNPRSEASLKVRETPERGVWVDGLSEHYVTCANDVYELLALGEKARATSSTSMNAVSSRSHSLFILTLIQKEQDGSTRTGKLNLADLAGSEKVGKTEAKGMRLDEAKKINQSLSALGLCINKLTQGGASHIPYRDSKLTHILRESLGGNSKTTLLIACSPHKFNIEETISTLKFGQRAKQIKNAVKINRQRSVAELEAIVARLTSELDQLRAYISLLEPLLPDTDLVALREQAGALAKERAAAAAQAAIESSSRPRVLANPNAVAAAADSGAGLQAPGTPAPASSDGAVSTPTRTAADDEASGETEASSQVSAAFNAVDSLLADSVMRSSRGGGIDSATLRVKLDQLKSQMQMQIEDLSEDLQTAKEERDAAREAAAAAHEASELANVRAQKAEEAAEEAKSRADADSKRLEYELKQVVLACEESGAHLSNLRAHNEELETSLAKQRDATAAAEADRDAKEEELAQLRQEAAKGERISARADERHAALLARAEAAEQAAAAAAAARDEQRKRAEELAKVALERAEEVGQAREQADRAASERDKALATAADAERRAASGAAAPAAGGNESDALSAARAEADQAVKAASDAQLALADAERARVAEARRADQAEERAVEAEKAIAAANAAAEEARAEAQAALSRHKEELGRAEDAAREAQAAAADAKRDLEAARKKLANINTHSRTDVEEMAKLRRAAADASARTAAQSKAAAARDERLREVEAQRQEALARAETIRCQLDESMIAYLEMESRYKARLALLQDADRIARKTGGGHVARPVNSDTSGSTMSPFRGLFGGGARTALPTRASLSNADKEGWLVKQGTSFVKNWKKRWFVLKGDSLYYFDDKRSDTPNGSVPLEGCFIQGTDELTRKKFSFGLFHPERRTFFLVADSKQIMQEWVDVLNDKINLLDEMYESDDE